MAAQILYLSGTPIPSCKASAIHAVKMCAALAHQGHDVTLAAPAGMARQDPHAFFGTPASFAIHTLRRPRNPLLGPLALCVQAQLRYGQRPNFDLLWSRDSLLALLLGRSRPLLYETHRLSEGLRRDYERRLLTRPNLAGFVVNCTALGEAYLARWPWLDRRCVIVAHNAHDPPSAPVSTLVSTGRLRLGYMGGLQPHKGLELMLALARRHPEAEFQLVGNDTDEVEALRKRSAEIANLQVFGPLPPAQGDAFRQSMDVLLLPTRPRRDAAGHELPTFPSPLKLFEYMATGRPIVASDLPAIREVLRDGEDALLVPPGDLDSWSRALERLRDPAVREQLGRAARRRMIAGHTWDRRAQQVLSRLRFAGPWRSAAPGRRIL